MFFCDLLFLPHPLLLPRGSTHSQITRFRFRWACSLSGIIVKVLFPSTPTNSAFCLAYRYFLALFAYLLVSSVAWFSEFHLFFTMILLYLPSPFPMSTKYYSHCTEKVIIIYCLLSFFLTNLIGMGRHFINKF